MTSMRSLPDWALRWLVRTSLTDRYRFAALIEIHRRAVESAVEAAEGSGAYPVSLPKRIH